MDINKTKSREYYLAIKELKEVFFAEEHPNIQESLVQEYESLINEANESSPGMLIAFNKKDYFSHSSDYDNYYKSAGIKAHMGRNLARVRSQLDTSEESPVLELRSFHFIQDANIRDILERDYKEIQRGVIAGNWKSVIILSGGSIEAILLDSLQKKTSRALSSSKRPSESDLSKWDLSSLIDVGLDIKLVKPAVGKLSHSVREYRNLIHPGKEKRSGLKVEPEEAKIALEVLNILIRELS
ncbi:hypothetical protein KJ605_00085 [Patescibacteria group bacterium]|nr:hypothetical protein [Patescibacteria group bacterium]MBU1970169.1 hypothetical protein [Patescibacteria group bacterium]